MNAASAIGAIQRADLPVFTTGEAVALWGSSPKAGAEMLRRLAAAGVVRRVRRGLWAARTVDPLRIAERIGEPDLCYVTGLTALRIHGMIEQIPVDIQVATTGRARRVATPFGRYALRHLQPSLFGGFAREAGAPIASPGKALFDVLYWGAARGTRTRALPELSVPRGFDRAALRRWIGRIPSPLLRVAVARRAQLVLGRL